MQKYQFTLLSALTALFIFNGCDSNCCQDVKDKIAPTPVITQNGQKVNGTITCDNAQVQTITLAAASQDSDGKVTQNIWTEDGNPVNDGIVQCPPAGQTKEVCLTAVDDDNLENRTCITVKGIDSTPPAPRLKKPVINISFDKDTGKISCTEIHDNDTIDTNNQTDPYGTDQAIKEIYWTVQYPDNTGHSVTQTEWNNANPGYTCGKWVDQTRGYPITITATPVDDDDQNQTFTFTLNDDGSVTQN